MAITDAHDLDRVRESILLDRIVAEHDEIEDALSEAREALGQGRFGDLHSELLRALAVLENR